VELSIVIPAFDEAERIGPAIDAALAHAGGGEVIVVDDGSTDGTSEVLAGRPVVALRHDRNLGKGAAVRSGVLASRGGWVLVMDADLSTPMGELAKLRSAAHGADVVIGTRGARAGARAIVSRAFHQILRSLLDVPWRDTQCGFKLFRGDVARELFGGARIDHFAFDVEILVRAYDRGLRIVEVPVEWAPSADSRVSIARDSGRMLYDLFRIRAAR
jgi:dolichyl-phosphate beta-glucosyltransferase